MPDLAEGLLAHPRCDLCYSSFFHPHTNPRLNAKQTNQKIYLSTMDLLVPATMKNAAKRDM